MYFKKLNNLEKIYKHDSLTLDAIKKLDVWLVNLSHQASKYINPLQFAQENHLKYAIAAHVFELAYQERMFKVFYRVYSSTGEVLSEVWSKDQIPSETYSFEENRYIPSEEFQIAIFFQLVDEPISANLPSYLTNTKKVRAPLFSNNTVEECKDSALQKIYLNLRGEDL